MKSKADKTRDALQAATEPGENRGDKRYIAARKVQKREAEGWTKVLVNGEPVTSGTEGSSISYLMVPGKA